MYGENNGKNGKIINNNEMEYIEPVQCVQCSKLGTDWYEISDNLHCKIIDYINMSVKALQVSSQNNGVYDIEKKLELANDILNSLTKKSN
jgi:hypothetical protein